MLIEHGAHLDVLCDGHTPLAIAVKHGNDRAAARLLRAGAGMSLFSLLTQSPCLIVQIILLSVTLYCYHRGFAKTISATEMSHVLLG